MHRLKSGSVLTQVGQPTTIMHWGNQRVEIQVVYGLIDVRIRCVDQGGHGGARLASVDCLRFGCGARELLMSNDEPAASGPLAQRTVFVVLGLICVGLGMLGLLLPLLPTTPFLLLATYLFARSSDRWHQWLLSHRRLGPYIHAFRGNAGLTRSQKLRIGASFTVLFGVSIYFVPGPTIKILLGLWWLFWVIFIYRVKTAAAPVAIRESADPRR